MTSETSRVVDYYEHYHGEPAIEYDEMLAPPPLGGVLNFHLTPEQVYAIEHFGERGAVDKVLALFKATTRRITELLQGEPLRFISYGSAIIIYLAARALGNIEDVSFTDAIGRATIAAGVVVAVTEFARNYVTPAND